MNKNLLNGVIKSIPKKWEEKEIQFLQKLKKDGLTIKEIAKKLNRTETSIAIKNKRINQNNDDYNKTHRKQKYLLNERFIEIIKPETIFDVYAGNSFYKNNINTKNIKVVDNDKNSKNICDYNLDSLDFLHKFRNKKIDLVDLDPYGSCFECFDYSLQIAQKGIIITFGEVGHKRWKRSDFVKFRYKINSLKNFNNKKFVDYVVERALIFNKILIPIFEANFKNLLRVYFEIKLIKKSVSGKEYYKE
tara:strand:+ start:2976 stop:3716 length:741 start_codon:yes stop_codon:yes gene_type:complete